MGPDWGGGDEWGIWGKGLGTMPDESDQPQRPGQGHSFYRRVTQLMVCAQSSLNYHSYLCLVRHRHLNVLNIILVKR